MILVEITEILDFKRSNNTKLKYKQLSRQTGEYIYKDTDIYKVKH